MPDTVQRISVSKEIDKDFETVEYLEVWLRDGKKESFNLKDKGEKQDFEKKYGKIPLSSAVSDVSPIPGPFERSLSDPIMKYIIENDSSLFIVRKNGSKEKYEFKDQKEKDDIL